MKHVFVVRTYEVDEQSESTLVLEHRFFGDTPEEASGYFQSHLRTDRFLADCVARQNFNGIMCRNEAYWTTEA